jgi:hypothetical protein
MGIDVSDIDGRPSTGRARGYLALALLAIPIGLVVLQAIVWSRYAVDVPAFDDWRQYVRGWVGSFDPADLFEPSNGTVSAVGRAIDAAVYVLIGGSVPTYELVSMLATLGALLFLQWTLLRRAIADPLLVASAFLLTLASLRAGTLWGHATMAFQQGVPIIVVLGCAWIVLRGREPGWATWTILVVLGILAGLTYISGAFAATAVALVLLVASRLVDRGDRRRLRRGGTALLAAGVATMIVQLWLVFGGGMVRDGTASSMGLTMPWEPHFWAYLLGIVGGSLWQPPYPGSEREALVNVAITFGLLLLVVGSVIWAIRILAGRVRVTDGVGTCALVLLVLAAANLVYLGLVAGARAQSEVPAGSTLLQYFDSGRLVHHPFWVTLLWPWVAASLILIAGRSPRLRGRSSTIAASAVLVSVGLMVAVWSRGSFEFERWYAFSAEYRQDVLECLVTRLSRDEPLHCEAGLEFGTVDLTEPVIRAMSSGASFGRYLRIPPAPSSHPTLFDLSTAGGDGLRASDGDSLTAVVDGYRLEGGSPTRVRIATGDLAGLASCRLLEVAVDMRSPTADLTALFVTPADPPGPERASPGFPTVGADGWSTLRYLAPSADGFADSLDLWIASTPVDIRDVEVRCRVSDHQA